MKKKSLALLLAAAMTLGLLTACGSTADKQSAAETTTAAATQTAAVSAAPTAEAVTSTSAEEASASDAETAGYEYTGTFATYPLCDPGEKTLTMWCEFPGFLSMIGIDSYTDCSTWKAAEQATGVHIDFTEVSMTTGSELFSLMCASGDMKDIMSGASSYYGSSSAMVEDEIAIDLKPYAEKYMGNYMTILNDPKYESYKDRAYNAEGELVEINSISDDYKPTSGAQIRADWLKEQNLDVPKTFDDWENTLKVFKDKYSCSAAMMLSGVTQMGGLVAGYCTTGAAESTTGSAVNMYQKDGKIYNGYLDDSYKAYLTMMNKWYKEGLLSPDFITASSDGSQNNTDSLILSGQAGIWYSQGNFIGQYETQAQSTNPNYSIKGIADPYDPDYVPDGINHFTSMSGGSSGGSGGLSVSTNCEDPELACEWMDYFWTKDGQILCNYGIEGEAFNYDANGDPQFTDMIVNSGNFQFYSVGYTLSAVPTLSVFDKAFFTYSDNVLDAIDTWNNSCDDKYTLPAALTLTTEQSAEYSGKFTDINTMAEERVGKFITGEADINTEWDTFQSDLQSMGIQDCIDIYQEAYDSFMARKAAE